MEEGGRNSEKSLSTLGIAYHILQIRKDKKKINKKNISYLTIAGKPGKQRTHLN